MKKQDERKKTPPSPPDTLDLELLSLIQSDGRIRNTHLSNRIKLSETPTLRRWKKLEYDGYIQEYRAILDRRKLGFDVVAFTQIYFLGDEDGLTSNFEKIVNELDWIQICHCITGNGDYLLQIVFHDFDERIKILQRIPGISSVQSHISIKEVKNSTNLPLAE